MNRWTSVLHCRCPMKSRTVSNLSALTYGTLLLVGCAGSSFSGGVGDSAGGSNAAGTIGSSGTTSVGATGSSGSSAGGTTHGGAGMPGSSGGPSSAGTTGSSGTSAGGATSGGAGNSGGAGHSGGGNSGTGNDGGVSNAGAGTGNQCAVNTDCMACAYPTAPKQTADCYCANCAIKPLAKTTCMANQAAWAAICSSTPRICPAIACIVPPTPVCTAGMCVAAGGSVL